MLNPAQSRIKSVLRLATQGLTIALLIIVLIPVVKVIGSSPNAVNAVAF
jgi:hypothetical protein